VIAVRTHKSWLPTPIGRPWLAIGPLCQGQGEWRRTVGVSASAGRWSIAVQWSGRRLCR
jgi:hypothetical protein